MGDEAREEQEPDGHRGERKHVAENRHAGRDQHGDQRRGAPALEEARRQSDHGADHHRDEGGEQADAAVKAAASAGGNLDGLKADGDPYGIVYTGTPAA